MKQYKAKYIVLSRSRMIYWYEVRKGDSIRKQKLFGQKYLSYMFNWNCRSSVCKPTTLPQDMCAINDPLGQTHSPASSDHYSRLKFVLFCDNMEKWGRTYGNMWENNDHYRPGLGISLVDQKQFFRMTRRYVCSPREEFSSLKTFVSS